MPNCSARRPNCPRPVKDLTAALCRVRTARRSRRRRRRRAPPAVAPRVEPVPYGEIPFDRSRLDVLRELLSETRSAGVSRRGEDHQFGGTLLPQRQRDRRLRARRGQHSPSAAAIWSAIPSRSPSRASSASRWRSPIWSAGVRQRTAGAITVALESSGQRAPGTPVSGAHRIAHRGRMESRRGGEQSGRVQRPKPQSPSTLERDSDEELGTLEVEVEVSRLAWFDASRDSRARIV